MNKLGYIGISVILITICIGVGYAWRMFHESDRRWQDKEDGMYRILWDISNEIPKGYDFSISIKGLTVDFMPRKDGKVVIQKAYKEIGIAGAGDNTRQGK